MGFGGGGQSSDDAINQLIVNTWMSWMTDAMNQQRQMGAAGEQANALAGQRGIQEQATGQAMSLQQEQARRDEEARNREQALIDQMNNMQASFEERMQAQASYEEERIRREAEERARLEEEARREKILADQKKQDELRSMRARLWAGGFEGTKVTGGQGVTDTAATMSGQLFGSPGQLPTEGDPTDWAGQGTPRTSVRGNSGQGILGMLNPFAGRMSDEDWLANWVGVPKGQKPAQSWVNEQYSSKVLGAFSGR